MAPEVYGRDYSEKCDLWSLGVTLYWLFSGRFPFWESGDPPAMAEIDDMSEAICYSPITFEGDRWSQISDAGRSFIEALLERAEEQRPSVDQALQHPWLAGAADTMAAMGCPGSESLAPGC